MNLKSLGVVGILTVMCSQCAAQTCSSEFYSQVSNDRCFQECGPTMQCICSDKPSPNTQPFKGCTQQCNRSPRGSNATITNCIDMKCLNLETCFQSCNADSCNMECKAKSQCSQECGSVQCNKMVCSSKGCYQSCTNCTMECTSETKTCNQDCFGGVCYSKCFAQSCNTKCTTPGDGCKVVIISSAIKHNLALPLLYLGFTAFSLTQN